MWAVFQVILGNEIGAICHERHLNRPCHYRISIFTTFLSILLKRIQLYVVLDVTLAINWIEGMIIISVLELERGSLQL